MTNMKTESAIQICTECGDHLYEEDFPHHKCSTDKDGWKVINDPNILVRPGIYRIGKHKWIRVTCEDS